MDEHDFDHDPDLQSALNDQAFWVEFGRTVPVASSPVSKPLGKKTTDPLLDRQLLAAVVGNDEAAARAALSAGANPSACQKAGRESALILAVTSQADALVALLLSAGANLNATTVKGVTALHRCLDHDRLDLAQRLIAAGADPDPVTMASERMIDLALGRLKQNPCPTMLAWLLDRGDRPSRSNRTQQNWPENVLRIVLNHGHAGLLAALNRTYDLPDQPTGALVLPKVGLPLVEKAWELALDRDSPEGLHLLIAHGWSPGLRQVGNARTLRYAVDPSHAPFTGAFWGWTALEKGATRCASWLLGLPIAAAMMADEAARFPAFTVGRLTKITVEHLTRLKDFGVALDPVDSSGERLFRRLAKFNHLSKSLVTWSAEHAPHLMTLRDHDGMAPLDLLRASDPKLASAWEARVLKDEVAHLPATPEPRHRPRL